MSRQPARKVHRCKRCGQAFPSHMRLEHHRAAEYAPKTAKDIRTTRDIPHSPGARGGAN